MITIKFGLLQVKILIAKLKTMRGLITKQEDKPNNALNYFILIEAILIY